MYTSSINEIIKANQQFMMESGEDNTPPGGNEPPAGNPPATEPKPDNSDKFIPKTRFDEINSKYKETQTQLEQLLNERKTQEEEAKKQQGKFEELYKTAADELGKVKESGKTATERVGQLESVINGLLESRLSNVPAEFHDLIPSNLTPEAKLNWLANAESKGLFGKGKPEVKVGESNGSPSSQQQANNANVKLNPIEMFRNAYATK